MNFIVDETDTLQWNTRDDRELKPSCVEKKMIQINGEKESNWSNGNEMESYHSQQNLYTYNQTNFHSMRGDYKIMDNKACNVSRNLIASSLVYLWLILLNLIIEIKILI